MSKHTPLPWDWEEHGVGEIVVFTEDNQDAVCIFDDGADGALYSFPDDYVTNGNAKANAKLIAMAVNNHAKLVEALRELVDAEWMVTHDWGGDRAAVLSKASSLLAQIDGEAE